MRPEFDSLKDYAEFSKYYWYRDELIRICKDHGLKSDGSKMELNRIVEAYFSGEKILPERKTARKRKAIVTDLTLNTGLLECGFTFGNIFREFFRQQTGEDNFKFNVDMVATVKAVKENGDENFTLGDLLDIYYGKKVYATYDRSALQWNKFVKDFCEDEATKVFSERLKAAAALWKIVRESDMEKKYSRELLDKYQDIIILSRRKVETDMASTKEYLDFVLEQLSELDEISYRAMMGEYILYYRGRVFGGIYDDRLLVKPVPAAVNLMPDATMELPYDGAKEMILVDDVDNREFLCELVEAMYEELPAPKKKV